jgi:pseudaminic acid synthase
LEEILVRGALMKTVKIADLKIGEGSPVFVVAELSANHCGSIETAINTIKAMKMAGADAVKLQTYTPNTMTIDCDNEYFQIKHGTIWDGRSLYDLYEEAYTPWEWHPILKKAAEELGLVFFTTPFDRTAVDFLETMNVPAYKIASLEITDLPLIEYIASKGKPVIISTGVATLSDIAEAIEACKRASNEQVIILKCTTEYPTPLEDVNIRTIPNMMETFNKVVGLSDHTLGISVPIAAVSLGACMVEKHFILSRDLGGPDAAFSLDPQEFSSMVKSIREVEKALGKVSYDLATQTLKNREFCRSLFVVKDVKAGEIFTIEKVRSIRPGHGLEPKYLNSILGQKARQDIKRGTPLTWQLIEE